MNPRLRALRFRFFTQAAVFDQSTDVIASHVAGLIEYGRLREEAEARARNLGLIHEVVQQVIVLNDKKEVAQITADLLAQYFAYELAVVMLVGENPKSPVVGFGGSQGRVVQNELKSEEFTIGDGITVMFSLPVKAYLSTIPY